MPAPTPSPTPSPTPLIPVPNSGSGTGQSSTGSTQAGLTTSTSVSVDPTIAMQERIVALRTQIQALQTSNGSVSGSVQTSSNLGGGIKSLAINMSAGSKGSNVMILQDFLISQGKEFQLSVGIKPASGYFGPITRAYILSNY